MLFASVTSMVGSGWLFGAFHAARIAGPLAIWSWVVGAAVITPIAFCFAELGPLFPRSGALVHMSEASHGTDLGHLWGWMLCLAYLPVPAVEAEAVVTYANNYLPYFLQPHSTGLLSATGLLACAVLLGLLAWLNLLAVRTLLQVNSAVTWWKIAVPVVTAAALILGGQHGAAQLGAAQLGAAQLGSGQHWNVWAADPGGYAVQGIFTALPAAGIVFSFVGFRTAIDLGGESANPGRQIPAAVLGSVLLAAVLYVVLQAAFLLALRPSDLAHGWGRLDFAGAAGPFAGLAAALGLGWLATLLYADAYVSPGGTALIYIAGGARILVALGETGAGPRWLTRLNAAGVPARSVLLIWGVGLLFLLPFPAWQLLVNYITSITVITYGLGPVVLLVLRRSQPDMPRPFRLAAAEFLAPLAFICSNWIVFWTGFRTNSFLFGLIGAGFVAFVLYRRAGRARGLPPVRFAQVGWLLPWFGGLWALSALGGVGGGYGLLGFWPAVALVALWSLVVIVLARRSALPAAETEKLLARLQANP